MEGALNLWVRSTPWSARDLSALWSVAAWRHVQATRTLAYAAATGALTGVKFASFAATDRS